MIGVGLWVASGAVLTLPGFRSPSRDPEDRIFLIMMGMLMFNITIVAIVTFDCHGQSSSLSSPAFRLEPSSPNGRSTEHNYFEQRKQQN